MTPQQAHALLDAVVALRHRSIREDMPGIEAVFAATAVQTVTAVLVLDAALVKRGKVDGDAPARAAVFVAELINRGRAVYYVSDGGYSRLCAEVGGPEGHRLGLDHDLSLPYALAAWDALCRGAA